jgi:hypothetical protein
MFDDRAWPDKKFWLTQHLPDWFYTPRSDNSYMVIAMVGPPDQSRSAQADDLWDSLPRGVTDVADGYYVEGWERFTYARKIGELWEFYGVVKAEAKKNNNLGYWITGGWAGWLGRYFAWLEELGGGTLDTLPLKQVGPGNPTWLAYGKRAMSLHGLGDNPCRKRFSKKS